MPCRQPRERTKPLRRTVAGFVILSPRPLLHLHRLILLHTQPGQRIPKMLIRNQIQPRSPPAIDNNTPPQPYPGLFESLAGLTPSGKHPQSSAGRCEPKQQHPPRQHRQRPDQFRTVVYFGLVFPDRLPPVALPSAFYFQFRHWAAGSVQHRQQPIRE